MFFFTVEFVVLMEWTDDKLYRGVLVVALVWKGNDMYKKGGLLSH